MKTARHAQQELGENEKAESRKQKRDVNEGVERDEGAGVLSGSPATLTAAAPSSEAPDSADPTSEALTSEALTSEALTSGALTSEALASAALPPEAAPAGEMTLEEALEFLTAIVRTPIGAIDEHSPLAGEVVHDQKGGRRVKGLNKLDALQTMAKFKGWLAAEKAAPAPPQPEDTMTAWIRRIRERE